MTQFKLSTHTSCILADARDLKISTGRSSEVKVTIAPTYTALLPIVFTSQYQRFIYGTAELYRVQVDHPYYVVQLYTARYGTLGASRPDSCSR